MLGFTKSGVLKKIKCVVLMSDKAGSINKAVILEEDEPICTCSDVYASEIIQAIQEGCDTLEKISEATYACQGCEGCRDDIIDLLDRAKCL